MKEYHVTFVVQVERKLTEKERETLREKMMEKLDEDAVSLPFDADVVTADVKEV